MAAFLEEKFSLAGELPEYVGLGIIGAEGKSLHFPLLGIHL